jgi:hypothetical protein
MFRIVMVILIYQWQSDKFRLCDRSVKSKVSHSDEMVADSAENTVSRDVAILPLELVSKTIHTSRTGMLQVHVDATSRQRH